MIQRVPLALLAALVLVGDLAVVAERTAPVTAIEATPPPTASEGTTPETLAGQLARTIEAVERLREQRFTAEPTVNYVSADDLRMAVEDELDAYTDQDADLDARFLTALGQLPEGSDLRALLVTAYGDQVAGYYDPETKALVIGTTADGERVGRLDELTLAHELGHSLVDQVIGFPDLEALAEDAADASLALRALIEGDATSLMNDYATVEMTTIDQFFLAREALELADTLAAFQSLPHVLRRSLEFPYVDGLEFVQHLRSTGGWAAVDEAYSSPPATTVEILEPLLYGKVTSVDVPAFGSPGPGWAVDRTLQFGAFDLLLLLEAPGGDEAFAEPSARRWATRWRGGQARQWSHGQQTTLGVHVQMDDAPDFCDVLIRWYGHAFPQAVEVPRPPGTEMAFDGPSQDAVIDCDGSAFRIGVGPDLTIANDAIGN